MDPRAGESSTPSPISKAVKGQKYEEIYDAIKREDVNYLKRHLEDKVNGGARAPVNLSDDPLLNVLIASKKSKLVIDLMKDISPEDLWYASNHDGDTAIHVAVKEGDKVVAEKLLERNKNLVKSLNNHRETPVHMAALYGDTDMFRMLEKSGDCTARRRDGFTVLHCAIMGNAPALALEIAERYPGLQSTRNEAAVTPLQLMVTIPDAFRSKAELGFFEDLFYEYCIPVNEHIDEHETRNSDLEQQQVTASYWPTKHDSLLMRLRNKFPHSFNMLPINMLSIILTPANWIRLLIFRILKQSFLGIESLEQKKIYHTQAMMLVEYLARDPAYWDFLGKGWEGELQKSASFFPNTVQSESDKLPLTDGVEEKEKNASGDSGIKRWNDSPLTLGAKFGLHDFVERILKVCPHSAMCLDVKGENVLQVAVKYGQLKIVKSIKKMTWGADPVLPSWLLSNIDAKTKNTILHFASEVTIKEANISSLQMQDELRWFDYVRDLLPKDLVYSRNVEEKTAQELFAEKHEKMIADARTHLQEMGKQYSSMVAAVVFASSLSIPGEQADRNNPKFYNKPAYEVFSHSYVIGLSCAATSLVLFLSLVTTEYRGKDFRRSIPTKYNFARFTFFFSLVALLVAFACNFYLSIYGERKPDPKHLIIFVCELTALPAICIIAVLKVGCDFGIIRTIRSLWY